MALKDTVARMHKLLSSLAKDLDKAARGNKAASQRVRTGTINMQKLGKIYRKESIDAEKTGKLKKAKSTPRKTKRKKAIRKRK